MCRWDSSGIHRRKLSWPCVKTLARKKEGGMMAGEEGTRREDQAEQTRDKADGGSGSTGAWSYFLVRNAIFSVTVSFIFVMALFAVLGVFEPDNAANVTAALGSLFGVVGALVGAYFGIKASSDAQDSSAATAKQAVQDQKETAQRSVETQKDASAHAGDKILSAAQSNTPPSPNPTRWALATLVPLAGGASLLVLRYYLRRMQDAG
jgi:hypothetical protein